MEVAEVRRSAPARLDRFGASGDGAQPPLHAPGASFGAEFPVGQGVPDAYDALTLGRVASVKRSQRGA